MSGDDRKSDEDPFAALEANGDDQSADDDPFTALETDDDGDQPADEDPFAALEDDVDGPPADDPPADEDPFAAIQEGDTSSPTGSAGDHAVGTDEDPFAALTEGDGVDIDDPFERMEVDELHDDEVWEALAADEEYDTVGPGAMTDGVDHVVNKRLYCQRCPHLSEPPETACTHEDGEILEVLEGNEFRVRNCPMVGEDGPQFDTHS
ncbi:hypothetical protein [Halorubrum vacuolatum]|uniref:DUF8135 domain-containing protein n=1 Tax=Halorubrum vacuolatum TaxID=63740 RepID=A0A238XMA0_HALVU|nr:hypothetical protein [Halorubrum vacuolatum]SNR60136.1 hypothetical protein SAMN06264855_12019 [Halorubrum vacuolatum]